LLTAQTPISLILKLIPLLFPIEFPVKDPFIWRQGEQHYGGNPTLNADMRTYKLEKYLEIAENREFVETGSHETGHSASDCAEQLSVAISYR